MNLEQEVGQIFLIYIYLCVVAAFLEEFGTVETFFTEFDRLFLFKFKAPAHIEFNVNLSCATNSVENRNLRV